MRMSVGDRQEKLVALVEQRRQLRVTELADALGVSVVTARRDVEQLAQQGVLRRTHGAVSTVAPGGPPEDASRVVRQNRRKDRQWSSVHIGMLVPSATYYYAKVVAGAREAVEEVGGRLSVNVSDYRPEEEEQQARRMLDAGIDGLLITPTWPTGVSTAADDRSEWLDAGVPTLLVERRGGLGTRAAALDRVCTDHAFGAYLAVRHLAGLGRERLSIVTRNSPTAAQLRVGFDAACRAQDLTSSRLNRVSLDGQPRSPLSSTAAYAHLVELATSGKVDGVLVHTDQDAILLVQKLEDEGIRVPDDIAVVAYDDEIAVFGNLELTAVAPPKFAVGRVAAQLLAARINESRGGNQITALAAAAGNAGSLPHEHLDLLPTLHVRGSSVWAARTGV